MAISFYPVGYSSNGWVYIKDSLWNMTFFFSPHSPIPSSAWLIQLVITVRLYWPILAFTGIWLETPTRSSSTCSLITKDITKGGLNASQNERIHYYIAIKYWPMLYSAHTNGFYLPDMHNNIPDDKGQPVLQAMPELPPKKLNKAWKRKSAERLKMNGSNIAPLAQGKLCPIRKRSCKQVYTKAHLAYAPILRARQSRMRLDIRYWRQGIFATIEWPNSQML